MAARNETTPKTAGASGPKARGLIAQSYDWILPAGLAASWLIMADVPPVSGGGVVQSVGMVAAAVALVLGIRYGTRLSAESLRTLGLAVLPVLALGIAALVAINPSASLAGVWGARVGWTLWASAFVWFVSGALMTRPDGQGRLIAAIALLGAGSAVAAFGDALGVVDGGTFWSEKPAGFFESSLSLAQFLVLGIGCAFAWYVSTGKRSAQSLAFALILVQLIGLGITGSRGAWAAAVVGLAAYLVLAPARALLGEWMRAVGYAVIAAFGAAILGLITLSVVAFESPLATRLDSLLTGRLTLWRAAVLAFAESPLLGRGPAQYSAIALWDVDANLNPVFQITYDPHSVVLSLLVGGGLVATAIAIWAASILGKRAFARTRDSVPLAVIAATLIAWIATVLSTWVAALALLGAAALAGSLLQAERSSATPGAAKEEPAGALARFRVPRIVLIAGTTGVALAVFALLATPFSAEIDWERAASLGPSGRATVATEHLAATNDPFYATWLVYYALDRADKHIGGPEGVDAIISETLAISAERRSDTAWNAPFAERVVVLEVEALTRELVTADELALAVGEARQADPASGFSDFLAAHELSRAGHLELAQGYAERALEFPMTQRARAHLETIAAGRTPFAPAPEE